MATYPKVNGRVLSYASIEVQIDGEIVTGIKAISYSDKMERAKARGAGRQPLGRTSGDYDAEGSMTLLREDFHALIDRFGNGWMDKAFDVIVTYDEEGVATRTDRLVGCLIEAADGSNEQGTDPLETELPLNILYIERNGISPFNGLRK